MFRIPAHLQRNSQSGIFYFRLTVPERLRHIVGRREIKKSLRTGRRAEAVVLAQRLYVEARSLFSRVENQMSKKGMPEPYSPEWIRQNAPWGRLVSYDDPIQNDSSEANNSQVKVERQEYNDIPGEIESEEDCDSVGEDDFDVLENVNIDPDCTLGKIVVPMTGPDGKINNITVEHDDPAVEADIAARLLTNMSAGQTAAPVPKVNPAVTRGVSLARLIRDCVNEKKRTEGWTAKTISENEAIFQLLKEVLSNPSVETIGVKQATIFKDTLLRLPPHRTKGRYAGKSVKEVLAMRPSKTVSVSSVNKYLRRVSSLFKWGRRHGYVSENPFAELGIKENRRAHKQRPRYTHEDVKLLLDDQHHHPEKLRKKYQFWLPILGIYTGARLEELCQLHIADIHQVNDVWVIDINHVGEKRVKTDAGERLIPLHPALEKAGFLRYVEGLRRNGEKRVFPELQQRRDGYSQTASKWFGRHRKKIGLDKDFHSLRHTVVDELLQLGADEKKVKGIVGHTEQGVTSGRYRKPFRPEVLLPVISMLEFDVDLARWEQ